MHTGAADPIGQTRKTSSHAFENKKEKHFRQGAAPAEDATTSRRLASGKRGAEPRSCNAANKCANPSAGSPAHCWSAPHRWAANLIENSGGHLPCARSATSGGCGAVCEGPRGPRRGGPKALANYHMSHVRGAAELVSAIERSWPKISRSCAKCTLNSQGRLGSTSSCAAAWRDRLRRPCARFFTPRAHQ
jgi:hypothetical protein